MDDHETFKQHQARRLWETAYVHQSRQDFSTAVELYMKSIELYPMAEAHTFLGWTYSMLGRLQDAIEECQKAVQVDPDFGNPYNDIGAYLIELGNYDEAIPWLEAAIQAPRYEARAHPHMNLGRVREHRLEWTKAMESYRHALDESSDYEPAHLALRTLAAKLS